MLTSGGPLKADPEFHDQATAYRPAEVEVRAAIRTCAQPSNLRRTLAIAIVVGCILSAINEGDVIVHGKVTGTTFVKIALNFVVPFIVSNLGVLAGSKTTA